MELEFAKKSHNTVTITVDPIMCGSNFYESDVSL
jgi:hypothetical protein